MAPPVSLRGVIYSLRSLQSAVLLLVLTTEIRYEIRLSEKSSNEVCYNFRHEMNDQVFNAAEGPRRYLRWLDGLETTEL